MERVPIIKITDEYKEFLSDESKSIGRAETISFPGNEDDIRDILFDNKYRFKNITIQGNLTGISGGAVPQTGHILNLSKMNKIIGMSYNKEKDYFSLKVQPGVLLEDLNHKIMSKNFDTNGWSEESKECLEIFKKSGEKIFPPDPTETLASVGGMVACNASGACSYHYGPTRRYVESLKVMTPDDELCLVRGGKKYLEIKLPSINYNILDIKNVAGYYYKVDMDLIDLFIGSEGTLGVISEIEIRLINKPQFSLGILMFFEKEDKALEFVKWLRLENKYNDLPQIVKKPVAIEYFNKDCFDLIKQYRNIKTTLKNLPEINENITTGIYVEFQENKEEDIDNILQMLFDGGVYFESEEGTEWVALDSMDYNKLKMFRHAVPECVNIEIDKIKRLCKNIKKIGTDMAVSNEYMNRVINMYECDLRDKRLNSVMFGHIGDNHIHVNIIPKNQNEYNEGQKIVSKWAEEIVKMKGTITAEHGVGTLKLDLFKQMIDKENVENLQKIKKFYDKRLILNKGIIF